MQLGESKLGCSINGHEEMELTFLSAHLGDIDVEVADGISFEWLFGWLVAGDLRQATDADGAGSTGAGMNG